MNPDRFSFARRRRGFTKRRLAELVDVSDRMISAYESTGDAVPSDPTLDRIVRVLRFPRAFFYREEPLPEPATESVSFRALSRMTAGKRDSAIAASALGINLCDWIESKFQLPAVDVPDLRELNGAAAAEAVRAEWSLGERRVGNMVHLLESRGVHVFSLAEDCHELDAFSFWYNGKPFVFLNTQKSGERNRMDAAHELGHLVMHRHTAMVDRVAENDTKVFGGSFLMPESGFRGRATANASLVTIVKEKAWWGVSASAYTRRLHDLELLSAWRYRQLCRQMGALKMMTNEPDPMPRETSALLQKVLAELRNAGKGVRTIAQDLDLHMSEVSVLLFGLNLTLHRGGGRTSTTAGGSQLREVT